MGSIVAACLTIAALLAVTNPTPLVRAGLTLATPLVAVMAFIGSWQSGSCPQCGARRNKQTSVRQPVEVEASSKTISEQGAVRVDLGWQVTTRQSVECQECAHLYEKKQTTFVPRSQANGPAEAEIAALGKLGQLPTDS